MTAAPPRARSAAGIVIYQPDFDALARLVASVAPDSLVIGIFANSPVAPEQQRRLQAAAGEAELVVLRPGLNRGLGAAYNALHAMARDHEAEFLLLLDQDSEPGKGMIPQLVAVHRSLAAAGERAAVVGPRPVDLTGRPMRIASDGGKVGSHAPAAAQQVGFVISSGSLLRVDALGAIGDFRADYFIDAIDIEWCMRAIARGFSIWVAPDVLMPHCLGRGIIRLPFGLLLTDQPPRRLYTYIRNQLSMLRLAHVPRSHKLKLVLSLPLRFGVYLAQNRFSRECRAALVNGVLDGLRNRLGPPDRALVSPFRTFSPRRAMADSSRALAWGDIDERGRP
ncbi:rhamnosyl transferase [Bosea sp. (in: a-proteobacteria)]|uniref:rhamnosyl transferase n=1 Tax=Bosea sp. (in: a-proteobacteria) TaxID=1871050 RepID=UPI003F727AE4